MCVRVGPRRVRFSGPVILSDDLAHYNERLVEQSPAPASTPVSSPRRSAGALLALLSFVILLASITFWVRSYRRVEIADVYTPGKRVQAAGTWRGGLFLFLSNIVIDNKSWLNPGLDAKLFPEDARAIWEQIDAEATSKWSRFGFTLHSKPRDAFGFPGARFVLVRVPLWVVALLAAPLPAAELWRRLRRWRWKRTNRCLNCGYDLRFTTGRCPECGAAAAGGSQLVERGATAQ